VARRPSRRTDRRRHHARAPDQSHTRDRGARSAAVSRAHGPGLLRECAQEGASRRGAPPAAVIRTARRSPAPPHHRVRRAPRAPAQSRDGAARPRPCPAGARGIRGVSAVIHGGDLAILLFFLVLNSFYALLLVLSTPEIWEQTRLAEDEDFQRLMQSDALPPI